MLRFHESRFQGVRLVCRLRRGTPTNAPSTPIGDLTIQGQDAKKDTFKEDAPQTLSDPIIVASSTLMKSPKKKSQDKAQADGADDNTSPTARVPEKYFIVKSLTLQDLDASVRNGIWATQAHNEAALNKAYRVRNRIAQGWHIQLTDCRLLTMSTWFFLLTNLASILVTPV